MRALAYAAVAAIAAAVLVFGTPAALTTSVGPKGSLAVNISDTSGVGWAAWEQTSGKQRWTFEVPVYIEPVRANAAQRADVRQLTLQAIRSGEVKAINAEVAGVSPAGVQAMRNAG